MNGPWISVAGTPASPLAVACRDAFNLASSGAGKMDAGVYDVKGYCGRKFRLFLNNLISKVANPRYLEIGVFGGATLCAAIEGNKVEAFGIDNWSWDKEENAIIKGFYQSLAQFKPKSCSLSILENDFRKIQLESIGPFNVMFYDGNHDEKDQYDGIAIPMPSLTENAIILVDDWNWLRVRTGTLNALKDAGVEMEFAVELRTSLKDDGHPWDIVPGGVAGGESDWHNGFFAAVIKKPR